MRYSHSICLTEGTTESYSPIYGQVDHYLSEGYAVVYALESDPAQVVQRMAKMGIEAENYIETGALTVIDFESIYAPHKTKLDRYSVLEAWHAFILKLKKTSSKGILIIGTAESFFKTDQFEKLVEYEKIIGKRFEIPLESVCCYDAKTVSNLSLSQLIPILNSHQYTIHKGWRYQEWNDEKIINAIANGLNIMLGSQGATLIFQTLKLIYKIDKTMVVSQPGLFETAVKKLFRTGADSVLNGVVEQLIKEMTFGHAEDRNKSLQ